MLRPGLAADLVVFDADSIQDLATFEQPHQFPRGVRWVVVSGKVAAHDGQLVARNAGRILHSQRRL